MSEEDTQKVKKQKTVSIFEFHMELSHLQQQNKLQ